MYNMICLHISEQSWLVQKMKKSSYLRLKKYLFWYKICNFEKKKKIKTKNDVMRTFPLKLLKNVYFVRN